jgi:hypothetical protein
MEHDEKIIDILERIINLGWCSQKCRNEYNIEVLKRDAQTLLNTLSKDGWPRAEQETW